MGDLDGISYREDFGLFWPDYDHNPIACNKKLMGRVKDADEVTKRCRERKICIQAGGHVGAWPMRLSKSFAAVWTFEPDPYLYQCLIRNIVSDQDNIIPMNRALGSTQGSARMSRHCSAGSWRINPEGDHEVNMMTIDSIKPSACDAIILDVEGSEFGVIKGAMETIKKFSPVMLLEVGKREQEAREYMKNIGYEMVARAHADAIFVHGT